MKKLIGIFVMLFLLAGFSTTHAQNNKFGHINVSELLSVMPERENAQKELQAFATELEEELEIMQTELEKKYAEYLKNEKSLNDVVKASRQQELQNLQSRIQEYQGSAQQNYSKKESDLLQPILNKANTAIQEVGKENGFSYIFDTSTGAVVYFAENTTDVMELVKKKLGIVTPVN
jgi:outer membrane protein